MNELVKAGDRQLPGNTGAQDIFKRVFDKFDQQERIKERIRSRKKQARNKNTEDTYYYGWRKFREFCDQYGFSFEPANPECVVAFMDYLAEDEGKKYNTVDNYLSAVSVMHDRAGYRQNPCRHEAVREYRSILRRTMDSRDVRPDKKKPVLIEHLQQMEEQGAFENGVHGVRNRALLLIGFAGAFRRSELVSLNIEDISDVKGGKVILLQESKTDQDGEGEYKQVPQRAPFDPTPCEALDQWLQMVGDSRGPVFRSVDRWGNIRDKRLSGRSVWKIVRNCMEGIGKNPEAYGGHSLRSGFLTEGATHDINEHELSQVSGHSSMEVLRGYQQVSVVLDNHPLSRMAGAA